MLNGIRPGPDGTGRGRVVTPTDPTEVEQIHQGKVIEARIHRLALAAGGVNHSDKLTGWGGTTGVVVGLRNPYRILRREQIAVTRWRRGPGNNELMCREAGTLIGLEHPVPERVLFGQLEVWIHI